MFVGTSDMNINVTKPQFVSFFVPVGIGVLAQMFCAGLLMAITAIGFTSTGRRNTIPQTSGPTEIADPDTAGAVTNSSSISTNEPPLAPSTEPAEPNPESPLEPGSGDPSAETPAEVQPVVTGKPLDDVRNRSRKLPIAGESVPDEIDLCLIRASDPTKVDLELLGGEFSAPQELKLQLNPRSSDGKSCIWKVTQVSAVGLVRMQDVGEFLLKGQQFSFRWLKDADKGKLPFCRLKISADSDTEVCDLWSSVHSPALRVSFSKSNQKMAPFVARGVKLPPAELLQLDLTFAGWPKHEPMGDKLVLNEELKIVFREEDSQRELLTILLTLKVESGQLAVQAAYATNVPETREGNARDGIKYIYVEKNLSHKDLEKLSAKMETESGKYQQELARLSARLNDLEKRRADLNDRVDAGDPRARTALVATQGEINGIQKQEAQAEELSDVFSAADAAMKQLSKLIDDIEKKGQIYFQLTRPLGGVESDVVISSSVNAAAVEAGRVP